MKMQNTYDILGDNRLDNIYRINSRKPVGYYINRDTYGKNFQPEDIMWDKISAAVYAFAQSGTCFSSGLSTSISYDWVRYKTNNVVLCPKHEVVPGLDGRLDHELHSSDPVADLPSSVENAGFGKNNMKKFVDYAHANNVPAILSVGGALFSLSLLDTIKNAPNVFINSSLKFLDIFGFDGIDISFMPYGNNWNLLSSEEVLKFVEFIKSFRATLSDKKLLTISISAKQGTIEKIGAENIKTLNNVLDYIFLMTYDMHGSFDAAKITNFQAPFKFDSKQPREVLYREYLNLVKLVDLYIKAGALPSKIFIGYPSYGITLSNVEPGEDGTGLYQKFVGKGDGIWSEGVLPYYVISEQIKNGILDESFNEDAIAVSGYNKANKMFVSYDNPKSIEIKACYAKFKGLAGMMIWSLHSDKFGELLDYANTDKVGVEGGFNECELKLNAIKNIILGQQHDSFGGPKEYCQKYYEKFIQIEKERDELVVNSEEKKICDEDLDIDGMENCSASVGYDAYYKENASSFLKPISKYTCGGRDSIGDLFNVEYIRELDEIHQVL